MNAIDTALAEFSPDDYTVRIVEKVFDVVPFAPRLPAYRSVDDAVSQLFPQATPEQRARAQAVADSEDTKAALWIANAIDTGDSGIAVYSGLKSALGLFFGKRADALESDPQQGVDAGLKLLALAYLAHRLFPGSIAQKLELFHTTPAGQALELYFGAVEVALPFADNAVTGTGDFVGKLMARYGGDAAGKLTSFAGAKVAQEASGMLAALLGPIEGVTQRVVPYTRSIAERARQYAPMVATGVDKAAGVVATAADALPVYRYLGARLCAEGAVLLASRGL